LSTPLEQREGHALGAELERIDVRGRGAELDLEGMPIVT